MVNQQELSKKMAGEKATQFIKDGMTIGLGSGSTIYWTLKKLGELIREGMNVKGIPSSTRTEAWARDFNIPLTSWADVQRLDLAIDGANEVDQHLNLIKGGGGSLVREKMVNIHSDQLIIVADESKLVSELGNFPLPVEVLPFGWEVTARHISRLGGTPKLRMNHQQTFVSDNGNYILDCKFDSIPDPSLLHNELKLLTGVVETGLFIDMADIVIVSGTSEIRTLTR
ncbi:ribose-5-phosphate isomerase RpiA [Bacillus sp. REN16]|uniref:ribose-5-phosphate isomerase RpiA n=1 Tax=Bacillus sp. REN16 TaxID=2887296 RepID=UPI001E4112E5|nr:ribose-5-phosphate isomerase RpiA [Bacillus sp. REN16]MCC3356157.1 ribose-5-phosphate isomerase RpiA [Bacillus sp. REN16]